MSGSRDSADETMDISQSSDDSSTGNDNNEDAEQQDGAARAPKRRKLEDGSSQIGGTPKQPSKGQTISSVDPQLVEHAKQRLSKWAARLFDPNRPRGLIEPPQTIPLNDEFLSAFGKREREFDEQEGRKLELDSKIHDETENGESENAETDPSLTSKATERGRKVKIANLNFQTSAKKLEEVCEDFGPLEEVNLVMDKDRSSGPVPLNSGRAYVTFEYAEGAKACMEGLTQLDGRVLRLSLATEQSNRKSTGGGGGLPRYWERDISTKCFRCGEVGHMESSCTNEAKARPCPLCASLDHEMRACPNKQVCFNCGMPGHVNRECSQPRGLRRRVVCGICFRSGHHRLQCQQRPMDAPSGDAICMTCGRRGHFLCKDMRWFYGLDGISCFNCGAQGHNGYNCDRPTLFQLLQDPELTNKEIDRAENNSM